MLHKELPKYSSTLRAIAKQNRTINNAYPGDLSEILFISLVFEREKGHLQVLKGDSRAFLVKFQK